MPQGWDAAQTSSHTSTVLSGEMGPQPSPRGGRLRFQEGRGGRPVAVATCKRVATRSPCGMDSAASSSGLRLAGEASSDHWDTLGIMRLQQAPKVKAMSCQPVGILTTFPGEQGYWSLPAKGHGHFPSLGGPGFWTMQHCPPFAGFAPALLAVEPFPGVLQLLPHGGCTLLSPPDGETTRPAVPAWPASLPLCLPSPMACRVASGPPLTRPPLPRFQTPFGNHTSSLHHRTARGQLSPGCL